MKTISAKSAGKKPDKMPNGRSTFVRSVARALRVIKSFGADSPSQSLSQVATKVDLDRATARRVLLTLENLSYLRREGRLFSLTPLVLELGFAYLSSLPFWSVANDVLRELAEELKAICLIVTTDRDYDHVVVVSSVRPSELPMFVSAPDPGRGGPSHKVAPGFVLLGALDGEELEAALRRSTSGQSGYSIALLKQQVIQDRERGWSFRSVPEENFCEIAAPLLDRQGRIIASMSVLTPLSKVPADEAIERNLPRILRATEEINKMVALKNA